MPYVFYADDDMPEGLEAADVVSLEDYNAVAAERDEAETQRDSLIERTETLESDLRKEKAKYANAFLTSPQRIKEDNKKNVKQENRPQTFADLFATREGE